MNYFQCTYCSKITGRCQRCASGFSLSNADWCDLQCAVCTGVLESWGALPAIDGVARVRRWCSACVQRTVHDLEQLCTLTDSGVILVLTDDVLAMCVCTPAWRAVALFSFRLSCHDLPRNSLHLRRCVLAVYRCSNCHELAVTCPTCCDATYPVISHDLGCRKGHVCHHNVAAGSDAASGKDGPAANGCNVYQGGGTVSFNVVNSPGYDVRSGWKQGGSWGSCGGNMPVGGGMQGSQRVMARRRLIRVAQCLGCASGKLWSELE